jgi:flagellin
MTVTDLANAKSESVTLAAGSIANGSTETYNFGNIGVKLTLNSLFAKGTDINPVNQAYFSPAAANFTKTLTSIVGVTTAGAASSGTLTTSFAGTGANTLFTSQLDNLIISVGGTATAATLANVTVGGHVFSTAGATQNLTAAGAKTWTFSDGLGNSFTVGFTADGAAVGNMSGTITLDQTAGGTIENSSAGSPSLVSITEATTDGSRFDFGTIDNARVAINAASATAASASITIGGQTFTTANTVGGGAAADLTTTGTKTMVLANTNVAATANTITLTFNVTSAFTDGDTAVLDMAQFGQIVGVRSDTVATTDFTFKVGTGTGGENDIGFTLNSATTTALGINSSDILTADNSNTAITALNAAITSVASRRADVGAAQSRLTFASNNISVSIQNTTAAQSSLLDVDVSSEITNFTNQNVLMQAGISLLGQANQQPALLLRLLQ